MSDLERFELEIIDGVPRAFYLARIVDARVTALEGNVVDVTQERDLMDSLSVDQKAMIDRLTAENEALREQLRWRKWPAEKPEPNQKVICDDNFYEYLDEMDGAMWGEPCGDAYECCTGDRWLPIPQNNGSDV